MPNDFYLEYINRTMIRWDDKMIIFDKNELISIIKSTKAGRIPSQRPNKEILIQQIPSPGANGHAEPLRILFP